MNKKTLSIILLNYNYSKFLTYSIDAILQQTRKPDELIIIDDGSDDNSIEMIKKKIKNIPYAYLVENTKNRGVNYSINKGLRLCSQEYVYFAASDDIISPNFIFETMGFLEKFSDIGLCCSLPGFFRNAQDCWFDDFDICKKQVFHPCELINILKKTKFWIATHTAVIKKDLQQSFDVDLKHHSDWFLLCSLAFKNKIGFLPKPLAFMRVHDFAYSRKTRKYKDLKFVYSNLMNKIQNEEKAIREYFMLSRILSCFQSSLFMVLIFNMKYWKYLPGYISGKLLRFLIRVKRKFLKIFCKHSCQNFAKMNLDFLK